MERHSQDELRELGVWWLPDEREHEVAGILTYSPTDGAALELVGMLRGPFDALRARGEGHITDRDMEQSGHYGRICGLAGGKSFTLEGCFRIGVTNMLAPQPGKLPSASM